VINLTNGAEIERIGHQRVQSVGRYRHDLAEANSRFGAIQRLCRWFLRINLDEIGGHAVSVARRRIWSARSLQFDFFVHNRFRRVGSARLKRVAEAAHRVNEAWRGRIRFDFLPQAENVDIHRAIRNGAILAPHAVSSCSRLTRRRAAHEKFQQPELGRGESQGVAG